jgi:hypothetical protein
VATVEAFNDVMNEIAESGDFDIVAAGDNAPNLAAVHALEDRLGRPLPPDYSGFLQHYGGFAVIAKEEIWPRPTVARVVASYRWEYGVFVLGIGKGIPAYLNIDEARTALGDPTLVPLLRRPPSDQFFCEAPDGAIYRWTREAPLELERAGDSFLEVFVDMLRGLQQHTRRIKENPKDGLYGGETPA